MDKTECRTALYNTDSKDKKDGRFDDLIIPVPGVHMEVIEVIEEEEESAELP